MPVQENFSKEFSAAVSGT